MPRIELSGRPDDIGWILAIMNFPGDEKARNDFYVVQRTRSELRQHDAEHITISREIVSVLLEAPAVPDIVRATKAATREGILAGDLLSGLYVMHYFQLEEPSLNKAIHCMRKYAAGTSFGDGSPLPVSEQSFRNAWNRYRSVAHLWGAFRLNRAYPFAPHDEAMFLPEHLPTFLGVAAEMERFGLSFVPKRAKPPLPFLDRAELWTVPEGVRPIRLKTDRRPDRLESWLAQYKAPVNNAWRDPE